MKSSIFGALSLSSAFALASAPASALLYTFETFNPNQNPAGGEIEQVTTTYDDETNVMEWTHRVSPESDSFWLVVTGGPNPKQASGEYVILYGDESNGIVTAYEYDGNNGTQSYRTIGNLLGTFDLDVTSEGGFDVYNFSIDGDDIDAAYANSGGAAPYWEGLGFGEKIGLWFHPAIGLDYVYDAQGGITAINYEAGSAAGWYDVGDLVTQVPEPGTFGLLMLGLGSLVFARRRYSKA